MMAPPTAVLGCLRQSLLCLKPRPCMVVPTATKFWEPDFKSGYGKKMRPPLKESLKDGLQQLGPELKKYREEVKEKFRCDSFYFREAGDYEVAWKFDNKDVIKSWLVTADSDHYEGQSKAYFSLSKNKTGIFHGTLNTEPPKDGVIKSSGYCNIRCPTNFKSFKREISYDWSHYTHMLIRCRGDGRPYSLVVGMQRYFDMQWNDQYNYFLFTKGGPYWQLAKIPFSKFFLSSKGRIQDKQLTLVDQLDCIRHFSITLADAAPGPFQLEIDFIAMIYDPSHTEEMGYELYKGSPFVHD